MPAPANDNFADRIPIIGINATIVWSNVDATVEPGEVPPLTSGNSTWWSWVASYSVSTTINTIGSSFDTVLAVYTGTNVADLDEVAVNDDGVGIGTDSSVTFTAVAGTQYQIAVYSYTPGATGNLVLNIDQTVPSNDDFADRLEITNVVLPMTVYGSSTSYTKEIGEPDHGQDAGGSSAWWTWTATMNGLATIETTGSDFDTTLGVYVGDSVDDLTLVAESDDDGVAETSSVTFRTEVGTIYQIAVDGFGGASGSIFLTVNEIPRPDNDDLADRYVIDNDDLTGDNVWSLTGTNVNATNESDIGESETQCGDNTVWWAWTSPATGRIALDFVGIEYDFWSAAVYWSPSETIEYAELALLAERLGSDGSPESILVDVADDTEYLIAIGNDINQQTGNIAFSVTFLPTPANVAATDGLHDDKIVITWDEVSSADGYYVYRATVDDSAEAVLITTLLNTNTYEDSRDLNPDDTYWYFVKTLTGAYLGAFSTSDSGYIRRPGGGNDEFEDRYELILDDNDGELSVSATGDNTDYTRQFDDEEPEHVNSTGGHSAWWTWTAPLDGAVTLDATNSSIATLVAAYTGGVLADLELVVGEPDAISFDAERGTTYQFAIDGADSATGALAFMLQLVPTEPPDAPVNVTASDDEFLDHIHISWDPTPYSSSYNIYRGLSNSFAAAEFLTTVDDTSYDDSDVDALVTYWYFIKANNVAGSSAPSTPDSGYLHAIADMRVSGNGSDIDDGDDTPASADLTDWETVYHGYLPVEHTFTLHNDGTLPLTISAVTFVPADDVWTTDGLVDVEVAAGATTEFKIVFSPLTAAPGVYSAVINIDNNSPDDKATYSFALQATVEDHPGTPEPSGAFCGRRQIDVDQQQGDTDYPFICPSDDLGLLIGEVYLNYRSDQCDYVAPFRVRSLFGFGTVSTDTETVPTHSHDMVIVDWYNHVVFDSATATTYKETAWGECAVVIEWTNEDGEILRVTKYVGWGSDDTPRLWPVYFEPVESVLDARTYEPIPRTVQRLSVVTDVNDSSKDIILPTGTNIVLRAGYNMVIAPGEQPDNIDGGDRISTISFDATPGGGLGRVDCVPVNFLRHINGVESDAGGNLLVDASACYRIERPIIGDPVESEEDGKPPIVICRPASLKLSNDCGPCCECRDFLSVYEAIRRLTQRYNRLGQLAEAVRDQYQLNIERWNRDRRCRKKNRLRIAAMALPDCRIAFAIGLCNATQLPMENVWLRACFNYGPDTTGLTARSTVRGCVVTMTTTRRGNVDPSGRPRGGQTHLYQMLGDWPTYNAHFDCINPGTMGVVTFVMEFYGCGDGDYVELVLRAFGEDTGNAEPIKEHIDLNPRWPDYGCEAGTEPVELPDDDEGGACMEYIGGR